MDDTQDAFDAPGSEKHVNERRVDRAAHLVKLLQRASESASVEHQILSGDESCVGAAQEGAGCPEFDRFSEALRRIAGCFAHQGILQTLAGLRPVRHGLPEAIGPERTWKKTVDGDIPCHRLPCKPGTEAREAGTRTIGKTKGLDR